MKLEPRRRPLTEAERRLLRCKMRWLRSRQRHVGRVTRLAVAIVIVLWISTLLSSDAPGLVATAFWVQEFCPAARFPSLDFSVIYPVDESGGAADMWIEKRGAVAPPQRVIPAEVKRELADRIPEPPTVVRGSGDRVEEVLRRGEP